MTQKRARHLLLELSRRLYEANPQYYPDGFGKTAKFYRRAWRPKWDEAKAQGINSYRDIWECDAVKALRHSLGM